MAQEYPSASQIYHDAAASQVATDTRCSLGSTGLTFFSASSNIGGWEIDPDDKTSVQCRMPKEKFGGKTDRIAFYVSASGKIGIGTKNPEEAFDVRDMAEDIAETDEEREKFSDATAGTRKKLFQASRTEANQIISGSLKGNASTATLLQNARFIRTNLGSTTQFAFNGGANVYPGVEGTLPVSNGGTGFSTVPNKAVIISQDSGTDTLSGVQMDGSGEILIGGSSGPAVSTLTAGSNITIANGDGSITISSTGGSTLTTEEVQDIVGGMFTKNTETNITSTYDDTNGKVDLASSIAHHKGSTTNYPFFGTDFFTNATADKTQVYLTPNTSVAPTAVIASGAGQFMCNKILPVGRVPGGIVVYGSSTKDTYKVYLSIIVTSDYGDTKTKYVQLSGGDNGTAINTGVAAKTITDALKTAGVTWSSAAHAISIVVTTSGANTIYGGTIEMT